MPKMTARRSTAPSLASLVASATADSASAEDLASRRLDTPTQPATPTVPLDRLRVRPGHNPRKRFNDETLREMADTIQEGGVVQPIVVEPDPGSGGFFILQGERRFRALRLLAEDGRIPNDHPVPIYPRQGLDPEAALVAALVENLQREELSPIEEADAFAVLRDTHGRSTAEIARRVGRSKRHVQARLQLLSLAPELRQALLEGELPAAVARVLAGAPADLQRSALDHFTKAPASLRTEEAVRAHLRARLVPLDRALFDPGLYETTHGGPIWVTETGDRDPGARGRYFADPDLFLRLQQQELDRRRQELRDRYEWVEEIDGWELPETLERDPEGPGAVVLVRNGLYDVQVIEGVRTASAPAATLPFPRRPARPDSAPPEADAAGEPPTPTRLARAARLRTRALQEAVASDPVAAMRAAVVSFLTSGPSAGLRLDPEALARRPDPPPTVARGLQALAQEVGLESAEKLLVPGGHPGLAEGELYHRLLATPRGVLVRMFAALVASTLDSGSAAGGEPTLESPDLAFELAHDLDIGVTDWRPTHKYFNEYNPAELRGIAERLGVQIPASASKSAAIQLLLASDRIGEYSPPELAYRPADPAPTD